MHDMFSAQSKKTNEIELEKEVNYISIACRLNMKTREILVGSLFTFFFLNVKIIYMKRVNYKTIEMFEKLYIDNAKIATMQKWHKPNT